MLDHQGGAVVGLFASKPGSTGERLQNSQSEFSEEASGTRSDALEVGVAQHP